MWLSSCEGERKGVCECDIWPTLMGLVVIAPAVAYERFNISIQWHSAHWHYLSLLLATSATICISNTGLLCPYAVNGGKMDRFCMGVPHVSHIHQCDIFSLFTLPNVWQLCCPLDVSKCARYSFFYIQPKMITNYVCHNTTLYIIIMPKL